MQIKQVGETKQKNIYCIKDRKIFLSLVKILLFICFNKYSKSDAYSYNF